MKGFGDQNIFKKKPNKSNKKINPSKEKILSQAIQFHSQGNFSEAAKYYQYFINQGFEDYRAFSNYGIILKAYGKLKEAELSYRKAIQLNPNFAECYSNLGNVLKDLGKLKEAELSYRKSISIKPDYANAFYNLGIIFKELGKLKEAELSCRKAIQLEPNSAEYYSNLGVILSDLGKLKEAELSYLKAIQLNPNFVKPYYALSRIKYSEESKIWQDLIFSENFLIQKSKIDKVSIYFTRANILHTKKKYKESSEYLKLANKLKLVIRPSKPEYLIDKAKALLIESDKKNVIKKGDNNYSEKIFVVGMPRSGSTLTESILSMKNDVCDLGESNFLEESFKECENSKEDMNFAELYSKKVNNKTNLKITINKNLNNYLYTGFIASQIPNARIIHCFRNPLDNILSIYRTFFKRGIGYSSSLIDCARIYLDQENVMRQYKNRFPSKIYDLNYDSLVTNPNQEIKSLIKWLGWEWDDAYLSPHLNTRSVATASNIQVRSPINSKSVGGWKNYKEMLKPAIEIITQTDRYRDLIL